LPGVPAVYIQSMLGSRNDYDGVSKTGMNRSINRQKYSLDGIEKELADTDSLRYHVFSELTNLIQIRKAEALFNPDVPMEVVDLGDKVFAVKRVLNEKDELLVIHNLANENNVCDITGRYLNLITGEEAEYAGNSKLDPYQFLWLKPIHQEEN
ncbi:sugar phosphorylase, partial [Fictibacillus sp. NRS-1165]